MTPEPTILGMQQARIQFRDLVDAAIARSEHTVITRHGRSVVALVPYVWYTAALAAIEDVTLHDH